MKSLLPLLLVFISSPIWSQTTALTEDFSGGFPAGWSLANEDSLTVDAGVDFVTDAWVISENPDSMGTGDSVITSTSWYDPSGTSDDWLITPAITLGSGGNRLYWDAISHDGSFADGYEVRWSLFAEVDSFLVNPPLFTTTGESPVWSSYNANLDSAGLTGQTVYLAFRNNSNDKFLLSLDNILVLTDIPVSIPEKVDVEVNIFPNPATSLIQVNSTGIVTKIDVYDLNGRLLLSQAKSNTLNVEHFPQGSYIVEIHTTEGVARETVVKK